MDQTLSGQLGFEFQPKSAKELYFLAYMDSLTTTYNRNMLEEMRRDLETKTLYVTMVDMDNLKQINDKEGHYAGDQAIRFIADQLKRISEAVFRLGGDEFLLLDRQPIDPGVILGISFGSATKLSTTSLSTAMREADALMYKEKRTKKLYREVAEAFGVPEKILNSIPDSSFDLWKSTFVRKGGTDTHDQREEDSTGIPFGASE